MAFRISKEKRKEIDAAVAVLVEQGNAIEDVINRYAEARQALLDILEGVADDMQGEYDDKSEKWQEGDKASAVSDWIEHLRGIENDIEEIDTPNVVASPDSLTINDAPEE